MELPNQTELRSWLLINSCINNIGWTDDYHITPDQLFKKPKDVENSHYFNDPQSGNEYKEQVVNQTPENRLSFDFCELSADQLLESTPFSYKNDRANGSLFQFEPNANIKHESTK